MTAPQTSSPLATGGAGTFFERDVNAYWLAQLLLRWIPPVLIGTNVIEVSFQTEHLGWKTDDFLITCEGAGGGRRRLAGQVKRTFSISAADEECVKAMLDFWRDFQRPQVFSRDTDRLVLQRGTESLLGHFGLLLDCARASRDAADFAQRLSTHGFISKRAVHYHEQIGKIVGETEGRVLDAQELVAVPESASSIPSATVVCATTSSRASLLSMPQRDPGVYLEDIEHYADAAVRFIAHYSLEQYLADEKTRAAVER